LFLKVLAKENISNLVQALHLDFSVLKNKCYFYDGNTTNISLGSIYSNDITLYPNPVQDELKISLTPNFQYTDLGFEVYTMDGILLMNKIINNCDQYEYKLSTEILKSGVYTLVISSSAGKEIKKFIKL
jgi:hypothetical protein